MLGEGVEKNWGEVRIFLGPRRGGGGEFLSDPVGPG